MSSATGGEPLLTALQQHFGHAAFREGQEKIIRLLLEGNSALALFPTGAGKSLCYQLPALLREGVTLVVSPLIALMKDQVQSLRARGIAAARLDSTLSLAEVQSVHAELESGALKLLFIAPERLLSAAFLERLRRLPISLLAVDEAHCISEWGHNFRPEYLRLSLVARDLGIHPVLALTATATPEVAADIRRGFSIDAQAQVQTSFRRPNLQLLISPCAEKERFERLAQSLRQIEGSAIVYVTRQQTAEEAATRLQRAGFQARAYHAGLPAEQRAEAQDAFMAGAARIIVSTIAFGMGIDKADIRAVFHYNLPKTLENYQQETGRAGRDGLPARCELFACRDDLLALENFIYGDRPTAPALQQLAAHVFNQGPEFDLSVYELSQATDIRATIIETVLTQLELDGLLQPLGSSYATCQFRLLQPQARVLAGHTPERRDFLARLFAAGRRGSKWTTLDFAEAAAQMDEPRDRIAKALEWLRDAGELELRLTGLRQRFRLTAEGQSAPAAAEIAARLAELFATREQRDAARLQQVIDFAAHPGCLTARLLQYFGETLAEPCGQCSSCLSPQAEPLELPGSDVPEITATDVQLIRALIAERHPALRGPRQLARFLCGISSPATVRQRLTRHDSFGLLSHHTFLDVLAQAESMIW